MRQKFADPAFRAGVKAIPPSPATALAMALILGGTVLGLPAIASGQPMGGGMPSPRAISGHPLPDRGMPVGTVTIRVARKSLANPVTQTEIVAIVEAVGGDSRKRTARTDGEGRATFDGLAPGSRFHAEIQVDGETVKTDTFTIPEAGGIRAMLIGGLGPPTEADSASAEAAENDVDGVDGAARPRFSLGVISGTAVTDANLPSGTIVVRARDAMGGALARQTVELGQVSGGGRIEVIRAITDAAGVAQFTQVGQPSTPPGPSPTKNPTKDPTKDPTKGPTKTPSRAPPQPPPEGAAADPAASPAQLAAAVVMSVGDLRFGTEGFTIPATGGVRVELRVPDRTSDPSVLTIGPGGRIILQLRDDALGFIETLPLINPSGKIFDPGAGGIEIPLPSEAVNAEGAEGEHKIEIRKGIGVAVHGLIPPRRPALEANQKSPDEITFGFVLPVRSSTLKFEQRFPNGLGEFTFVTEQLVGLSIESTQVTGLQERELGGKKYWLMRGEPIPPGGTLRFSVTGLPAADNTGKIVAAILSVGLLLAAVLLSRNPDSPGKSARVEERSRLVERREKLFADLVGVEARRAQATGVAAPRSSPERDDLVRKLENVYRDLATLDERRAS
jgi:hypothetical protein